MAENSMATLRIHNRRKTPVFFALEPRGEVHRMPAGATFEVVSEEEALEVDVEDDLVAVWGENYTVYFEGAELLPQDQISIDAERKALSAEMKR